MFQPNLNSWYIVYCSKDQIYVDDFLLMLGNITKTIGMQINKPQKTALRDDRTETYLREIQKIINSNIELIVIVFPTNRTDRYSAVKK